jgi:hypothetical protein
MKPTALISSSFVVLFLVAANFATAGVVWSGGTDNSETPPGLLETDCIVGSLEPNPQYAENVVQSQFEFAFLIDPTNNNCCEGNIKPENITFYLNYDAEDLAWQGIQVAVLAASSGLNGLEPSTEICATPLQWSVNADIPGFYQITLPPYGYDGTGNLNCPCLDSSTPYFLVARILATIAPGAEPDGVHDNTPVGGRTFVRQNGGVWQDVVTDLGWSGEIVMNADVACCEVPIPNRSSTWGELKSQYR